MNAPIPAPRNLSQNDIKKPVPTPRKTIPIRKVEVEQQSLRNENFNINEDDKQSIKEEPTPTSTFSRRVRKFSNTSKQIKDELTEKVNEKKKMVIEGTRQSMKRITRRFTTSGCENSNAVENVPQEEERKSEPVGDIFNKISFKSPIKLIENDYANSEVDRLSNHSSESLESLPPPMYPPPPLREDAIYDKPQSLPSSSGNSISNSSGSAPICHTNSNLYESVFPSYPNNSDSESCTDTVAGTIDKKLELSRSDSWYYYDSVSKNENIYSNVDATPPLIAEKVEPESTLTNNVISYENYEINRTKSPNIVSELKASPQDSPKINECRKQHPNLNSSNSPSPSEFSNPFMASDLPHNNLNSPSITMNKEANALDETLSEALSGVSVRNSLYENCAITPPPRLKKGIKQPTKSLIMQFDPLSNIEKLDHNITDLNALEELLQGDLCNNSSVITADNWSASNESEVEEYMSPPTPPIRFDSLPEETMSSSWEPPTANQTPPLDKSKTSWFLEEPAPETPKKRPSWFKQVSVRMKVPEKITFKGSKDNMLVRPALVSKGMIQQKGMLYKITSGPVEDLFGEFSARWCILETGNFYCYSDNVSDTIKEHFPMENIMSIQVLLDQKFKYRYENDDLHCFELNVSGKSRGGYVYGSRSVSERRVWMQKIAESMTNRFSAKITSDYSRMGWAYVREGISGEWAGAWVILSKRILYYAIDNSSVKSIDLRKARCIEMRTVPETEIVPTTNNKGPNMVVDCPSAVLYLRMWTSRETKAWCHIVRMSAHSNGALLEQQQLTKNDVPVIVEKCINFIYAHGSMCEGIYRRAGGGGAVQELLTQFRRDAWAVQLTIDKYSEHDVATVLKRFFRDLPEPLLSSSNRQYLCQVSLVKSIDDRVRMYKAVFDQFNPIAYKTIRRLLGHLHFINSQSKKNLMTIDNLAAVWGPTLMQYDDKDGQLYSQKEVTVVGQLISLYKNIFAENAEEVEQERQMLQVLEKCTNSPQGPVNTKSSGDLRVWIYLHNKDGETFNVAIGPHKTAYDVCLELSSKAKIAVHELILEEFVLNGNLYRPVHYKEKVLDVVLRWGYWCEADRKDNILVLSPLCKYWEFIQDKFLPVSGELKFADNKSRMFKNFIFELAQAKLTCYKDKTCAVKLSSWNIEDIVWYLGNEPKRNPQSKWTITFFPKNEPPVRAKSKPWFGNILVWTDPAFRAMWLSSMLRLEHPTDLTPPPQHVNLMSA
ncbi:arf-GAP with Rho-GAP domain, ANK repeat and PH domain-containing protein 1 [Agrilus planipennis]|uniref:Arf-GAP with Rho-GAP domain, ANK repeat and PH domain-containing protein 1 n=1 Tax=Agrilus planipennis TaxID=224129 RepID=A0A1W4XRT0_AGRPL|nr:arf-GAP with Rho-GAP domain, ANK repeat and PH domain-containing protein 1 [Agrilus planipennis]XP_018335488.1 arf-GAP with Rho-GAP domain, ANK repeat and PH domain-containing protein 1 [Agrilus planipennis]